MKLLTSTPVVILLAVLCSAVPMLSMIWKESIALVHATAAEEVAKVEASRPEKPWDFWTPEIENLARELTEQRENFERRESELASREKRLADEARELDQIRRQIELLRGEIDARIVEVQASEMRNLKSLASTYSRLTPAAAVSIFEQLDDLTVAKLLSLMKPEITSAILEEMSRSPGVDKANIKRAAELSQRLRLLIPPPKLES